MYEEQLKVFKPFMDDFEEWIKTRKLCTKYNAYLKRTSDGLNYCDVRVNGHWIIWRWCVENYGILDQISDGDDT